MEQGNRTNLARAQNQASSPIEQVTAQVTNIAKKRLKWWLIGLITPTILMIAFIVFVVVVVVAIILPASASAQPCNYGFFEVLRKGDCIDEFVGTGDEAGFVQTISFVIELVLGVAVGLGLIMIVIAGYVYMTAGGNASRVGTAKTMIMSALLGIVLAIAASLILNTISPQFSANIQLPFVK